MSLGDVTGEELLTIALKAKDRLDMTIEEYDLARRFPLEYDLHVNGIKHIIVRDLDKEYRYIYKDGEINQIKEVF